MSILSIQSHVAYGYVGNRAAVYPLQSLGYDVWQVNTVQFSNHTGYGKWRGEIFSRTHIRDVIKGIEELGIISQCRAILSGYMGSVAICEEVFDTVTRFKSINKDLLYLCDPVIGGNNCHIHSDVCKFYKKALQADIITPNQHEAETLSGIKIVDTSSLKSVTQYFHERGIKIIVITGIQFPTLTGKLITCVSDNGIIYCIKTNTLDIPYPLSGTGDLFSAVYLGSYLYQHSAALALQHAIYYTDKALQNTYLHKHKELQVTSLRYDVARIDNTVLTVERM